MTGLTETVSQYDETAGIWRTIRVPVYGQPATRTQPARTRRPGRPVDRTGLSAGSPFAERMDDTAFTETGPLADMRRHVPEPYIKTHRPAVVWPAGKASDATAGARWHDL
jgi:hypothetical protein